VGDQVKSQNRNPQKIEGNVGRKATRKTFRGKKIEIIAGPRMEKLWSPK